MLDIIRYRRSEHVSGSVGGAGSDDLADAPHLSSAIAGAVKETNTAALLEAEIQGHPISTHALVVNEIGNDEDGTPTEIRFGALAMQQWGIRPVPDEQRLDLSHYPEEFVEF